MKIAIALLLLLAACTYTNDDYAPWEHCQKMNLQLGKDIYQECVENERLRMSDDYQREQFKRLEQYEKDIGSVMVVQ